MKSMQAIDRIKEERRVLRAKHFQAAKDAHASHSRKSGYYAIGRDSHGTAVETRKVEDLRMIVDKWYVRMSFKREDREKLKGSWKEVEAQLKKEGVPRKLVRMDSHIICAVRTLKHVRQGYEDELDNTDTVLSLLGAINTDAAGKCGTINDSEIGLVLSALDALDSWLSRKQVAVKRVVSRGRLAQTREMFEQAREKKGAHVARACAVFTSLRNRLGTWRDKQVAGIAEYTWQRECALRVERDRWLFSRLTMFSVAAQRISQFQMYDRHKLTVLAEARRMLREKEPNQKILRYLEANKDLFRVSKRAREKAEERIALMEKGRMPKDDGTKTDYLIGHYAWLYRHVRAGEKEKALAKLDYLELFVNANKPGFILDELSKEPDHYMGPIIELLRRANEAFGRDDFDTAKQLYAESAEALGRIVYPKGERQ
jgi:hypothetical protein